MQLTGVCRLKKGKEKTVRLGHPWIFSGAVLQTDAKNGTLCRVESFEGDFLGIGYINERSNIRVRMLGHLENVPEGLIHRLIQKSIQRRHCFDFRSNAKRLVNGENDGLSGLIADLYDDILVLQFGTLGMQNLKEQVIQAFQSILQLKGIYEKSTAISRKEEGLTPSVGWLAGDASMGKVEIYEEDIRFIVDVVQGQKTGFFLDQRQMRYWVRQFVQKKKVLNLCAYSGGFSLHALKAGAADVTSVDLSKDACEQMDRNTKLNGLENHKIVQSDVFAFLKNCEEKFDFVIVDPPAFIKSRKDIPKGTRAYRELNREALRLVAEGGILMSSSCSHFMEPASFDVLLMEAALLEGRDTKVFQRHIQAFDHLKSIAFREGDYLKSVVQVCL
jgi:23S rRNA (cytosine1962-C5)-methyltransferase